MSDPAVALARRLRDRLCHRREVTDRRQKAALQDAMLTASGSILRCAKICALMQGRISKSYRFYCTTLIPSTGLVHHRKGNVPQKGYVWMSQCVFFCSQPLFVTAVNECCVSSSNPTMCTSGVVSTGIPARLRRWRSMRLQVPITLET